ncbi:hypothetical protein LOK49_LG07G02581 [Camellia lanceoleosa]|uniref:Uncharacterized protein n=1 Tax=Camellia lanceoleosa TaxID=1840588 RepID=A0ACC0GYQ9_9ERIC|nr:hypothetical protein LOK49_LG07G02581 [Camellia lanceoleosa]
MSDPTNCNTDSVTKSQEEEDHLVRSTKKIKSQEDTEGQKLKSFKEALAAPKNNDFYFDKTIDQISIDEEDDEGDIHIHEENLPQTHQGIPQIQLPKKLLEQIHKPWSNTLIVRLLGKSIGYKLLCTRVKILWGLQDEFNDIDLGNNYFLFKFSSLDDCAKVYLGGPWVIMDHYLTVCKWELDFKVSEDSVTKSQEEEDHLVRSTKKIKSQEDTGEVGMDIAEIPSLSSHQVIEHESQATATHPLITEGQKLKSFKKALAAPKNNDFYFDKTMDQISIDEEDNEGDTHIHEENLPQTHQGIPQIQLPKKLLEQIHKPWSNTLIVRLLGAANNAFKRNMRELLSTHKPAILILMETKIPYSAMGNFFNNLGFTVATIVDPIGRAGGIWLLWDTDQVNIRASHATNQVIQATIHKDDYEE